MIFTRNQSVAWKRLLARAESMGLNPAAHYPSLTDFLAAMPVLSKQALLALGEAQQDRFMRKGILFSETSGSTGKPLVTPRDQEDLTWNTNNQMIAYKRHLTPGIDRVAVVHPGVLSPFVEASCLALNNLGIGFVRLYAVPRVCDYQRMYDVLSRHQITTLMTTPTLANKLLFEFDRLGLDTHSLELHRLLLTGEPITEDLAANFRRMGTDLTVVPFVYGSSETATVMIGREDCCYDLIDEDFVFELVDPDTHRQVPEVPGQVHEGKLLISWLRDGLLPIFRYDTGDIFRIHPEGDTRYRWECIGRQTTSAAAQFSTRDMDRVIFQSPLPIYHYDCSVEGSHIEVNIIAGKDSDEHLHPGLFQERLSSTLGSHYSSAVHINPSDHDFYEFSVKPKMSRLTFIN